MNIQKHCVIFLLIINFPQVVFSQNTAQHIADGILYQLQTPLFIYTPQEDIRISYQVFNISHPEINFKTDNYNLASFFISVHDSTAEFAASSVSSVVEHRLLPSQNTQSGVTAKLSNRLVVQDGDTLNIEGKPRFYTYIVGLPAPENYYSRYDKTHRYYSQSLNITQTSDKYQTRYDLNKDGIINFTDWLLWMTSKSDRREVPQDAHLSLSIFVRNKTADVNRDGQIDEQDLDTFRTTFGSTLGDPNYSIYSDLTGNGKIDLSDFTEFISLYTNKN